ncbi:hypothetical protein [Limnoglobus roseus]|uniref:Uncharacterized protein n=1 Tax=Limnoglobus roseus TaxID=2598579 RepID=A0A5C1ASF5_9BACT|nr:hypothetical protein [Limnoglobus roseus]QEL20572.1 hypothetical protein PX52LOC_07677 [Limnoglobus roseus]
MGNLHETRRPDPSGSRGTEPAARKSRPRTWAVCPVCSVAFPVPRLSQRHCSLACKFKAQTTGRKVVRRTVTKARSAQSLLRYHVQAGNVVRPSTCEECGRTDCRIEGAHFNYDEPLRVRWLCVPCHRRWDMREPKGATYRLEAPRPDPAPGEGAPARSTATALAAFLDQRSAGTV